MTGEKANRRGEKRSAVTSQLAEQDFTKGLRQADIVRELRSLGVIEGMGLEVHSSLSSFDYVEGGAETVVDALLACVGENGAIVMSAFPMSKRLALSEEDVARGLTCKIRIFPEDSDEASGMGVIVDTFRRRPDVLTGEGLFRVAAWGKDKELNSLGFGNLIAEDQWALLLGVDIYSLTSMHYMEAHLPDAIRVIFRAPAHILELYPPDQWYVETGVPAVKAWYKIQDQAFANGSIRECTIGKSRCMLFKINDVISLYRQALIDDPFGLYGIEG